MAAERSVTPDLIIRKELEALTVPAEDDKTELVEAPLDSGFSHVDTVTSPTKYESRKTLFNA